MQEYFKIGEISKLYGIGVDSLRYYEKIGILSPERAESGYRHYSIQDIWKLNSIRDLRELGFDMKQIRHYLEDHSVHTTLQMLEEEKEAIQRNIKAMEKLKKNVEKRTEIIRSAVNRPLDTFSLKEYPPRKCYFISEGYSDEHEMDLLIKRLMNMDKNHLYVIGNNQIGTAICITKKENKVKIGYRAVFAVDEKGEKELPGGTYLSVSYQGKYEKTQEWATKILDYADKNHMTLIGDILELLWIDIHVSSNEEEHVTELQVLIEKK